MNPLSKIIRPRKNAKGKQQPQEIQQQPAEAPRPLDESEMKLVGGGGGGGASTGDTAKKESPRGTW